MSPTRDTPALSPPPADRPPLALPGLDPVDTLVNDVAQLTGLELPAVLSADAPTLSLNADPSGPAFYLIGLIGGKDVGKSTLAHAIAGVTLGKPSNTGEGTRNAMAYVHRANESAVRDLLATIVPDRFDLVVHDHDALRTQVLVDLPDIDSKYEDHVELTRTMLRHLLFPVFVQSVEKYADQRPQQLLAQVAEGNDPANFIFCLTKVDQLVAREGEPASVALADDYANRLKRLLGLGELPRVHRVSAIQPDRFDLPTLRRTLSRDRDRSVIERSLALASSRRRMTLLRWVESQRLDQRLARATRTIDEAHGLAEDKLMMPLQSRVIPRLLEDPSLRGEIADRAARRRLLRWPIVNVIDTILAPLTAVFRRNLMGLSSTRQSVRSIVNELTPPLDAGVRSLFAEVRRRDPSIADLYGQSPPWSEPESEAAVAALTTRLADALEVRKRIAADRAGAGHGAVGAPIRWLLTLGAVVWFPFVQPVLAIVLAPGYTWAGFTRHAIWSMVQILGSTYLLQSVGFLAIYFLLLWAALRFLTMRRADRLISQLDAGTAREPSGQLDAQAEGWVVELLAPLKRRTDSLRSLVERIEVASKGVRAA